MTEHSRILVGLSSENGFQNILNDGAAFAKYMGAEMDVVHVYEPFQDPIDFMYSVGFEGIITRSSIGQVYKEEMKKLRKTIRAYMDKIEKSTGISMKFLEAEGNPGEVIVDLSGDYNLVLIGSEIEGEYKGKRLGPVARNVVRFAESPVVVLREEQHIKRFEAMKNILVPVDGSNVSNFAAAHAANIAEKVGGKVTLLNVWDKNSEKLFRKLRADNVKITQIRDDVSGHILDDAESTMMADVPLEQKVISGDPDDVIVSESKDYDLVVIGTWGKGGIKKFLLGSTAENTAQHAECPVLLVRGIPD